MQEGMNRQRARQRDSGTWASPRVLERQEERAGARPHSTICKQATAMIAQVLNGHMKKMYGHTARTKTEHRMRGAECREDEEQAHIERARQPNVGISPRLEQQGERAGARPHSTICKQTTTGRLQERMCEGIRPAQLAKLSVENLYGTA